MPTARFSFGTSSRIRHKADFARLQKRGRKLYALNFLVVLDKSPSERSRFAVAVTKKLEPRAAHRNKLRRRLKEYFRTHQHLLREPFDILIVARKDALSCDFAEISRQLTMAFSKAGLFRSSLRN